MKAIACEAYCSENTQREYKQNPVIVDMTGFCLYINGIPFWLKCEASLLCLEASNDTYFDRKDNYEVNDDDNPDSWDNKMKKIRREYSEDQAEWARRNDQPRHIVEQYDNEAGRDFYEKYDEERRLKYDSDVPPSYYN